MKVPLVIKDLAVRAMKRRRRAEGVTHCPFPNRSVTTNVPRSTSLGLESFFLTRSLSRHLLLSPQIAAAWPVPSFLSCTFGTTASAGYTRRYKRGMGFFSSRSFLAKKPAVRAWTPRSVSLGARTAQERPAVRVCDAGGEDGDLRESNTT